MVWKWTIKRGSKIFNEDPIEILGNYNVDEGLVDREILTSYYPEIEGWFNRKYVPKAKWAKDQLFSNLISDITYLIHPIEELEPSSLSYHVIGNYREFWKVK